MNNKHYSRPKFKVNKIKIEFYRSYRSSIDAINELFTEGLMAYGPCGTCWEPGACDSATNSKGR